MRMIRRAALAMAAVLAAGPAAALECVDYDPRGGYWIHQDRTETYIAVYGTFVDVRRVRHDRAHDLVLWRGTFRGHSASARAFDRPFEAEVEIVEPLFSAIFGPREPSASAKGPGAGEDRTGIVYLEQTDAGYRATIGLCGPLVDTDPASLRPTLACLAGRRCPRPD